MSDQPDHRPQDLKGRDAQLDRLPQRLRRRLAALSAVGAVMVLLPLVQVLRHQNAQVQALFAERAGWDPVARAVQVQRGLLAHRDVTGQVLRGRDAMEPERKLRQGEVDARVAALAVALGTGQWHRAISESNALREDWTLLTRQVLARSVNAVASDQAHRLLLEQTLQVIDLVADDLASARAEPGGGVTDATLAVVHTMPRLAWQIAALATPGVNAGAAAPGEHDAVATRREIAGTEAVLARTLSRLDAALERQGGSETTGGRTAVARVPLAAAGAAAGATADRYFQLLRNAPGLAAETQAAGAAALRAQWRLFDLAHDTAAAALERQSSAAEQLRAQLLSALGVMALAAVALGAQLWRGLRALQGGRRPPTLPNATAQAQSPQSQLPQSQLPQSQLPQSQSLHADRSEASRLLQRLRDSDLGRSLRSRNTAAADHRAPQPTPPPDR